MAQLGDTIVKGDFRILGELVEENGETTSGESTSWGIIRNFSVADNTATNIGSKTQVDGSEDVTLTLPATIKATLTGNADTATTLKTARNFYVSDNSASNTGPATSFNGSGNATIKLPATIKATLTGNADTATTLKIARTIGLSGAATGTATSFNGSTNITIPVTSLDASKLTGTAPVDTTGNAGTATKLATARTINGTTFDGSADITISKLRSIDDRDIKPVDTTKGYATYYFSSKGGLTTDTADSTYVDLFVLNGWTDTAGGSVNALAFGKKSKAIYHYQAAQGATTWGDADQIAYTTSNVESATKLETARTIDGVSFNGSANITHYGSCSTAAATAAKVVSCTGFTLATGAKITVKFTVTNTAANPTLNVNSTGAKAIYYRGAAITAGYLAANRTYTFVYNGTQYELIGDINIDTDTDSKVTNTLNTTTKAYITGTTSATTNTGTQIFDTGVYLDTTAGTLTATTFKGVLSGNASTASSAAKLTTARTINGVSFDGSANITVKDDTKLPLSGGTLTTSAYNGLTIKRSDTNGSSILLSNSAGNLGMIGYDGSGDLIVTNGSGTAGTANMIKITSAGATTLYGNTIPSTNNSFTLGSSSNKWSNVYATTFTGALSGNASTASSAAKLTTARKINGTSFDGSADITTANWGTARNISISDNDGTNTGTAVSVNGSAAVTLKLPATIKATLSGNASTASSAAKLTTARKISITGDATGSATFDGSADVSISTTTREIAMVGSDAANSQGWYKVMEQTMSSYCNSIFMFAVSNSSNSRHGILYLNMRCNNTNITCNNFSWMTRTGFTLDHFIIVIDGMKWTMYHYTDVTQYYRTSFEIILKQNTSNKTPPAYTFANNTTKETTTPTASKVSNDSATVSNAGTATNATNVTHTLTNPTSGTWYYPTFISGIANTTNYGIRGNNGLRYYTIEGTTTADGRSLLSLGNGTASGTAGNKYGEIWIYGTNTGYVSLKMTAGTAARTITFPDATGTVALTGHTHSYLPLSGGTVTGTLVLSKSTDLAGTADNSPALIVGGASTVAHIEIDPNEIQAKSNGTTVSQLNLNTDGGLVNVGSGGLTSSGRITAASLTVQGHKVYIQTSAPTSGMATGDIWIDI